MNWGSRRRLLTSGRRRSFLVARAIRIRVCCTLYPSIRLRRHCSSPSVLTSSRPHESHDALTLLRRLSTSSPSTSTATVHRPIHSRAPGRTRAVSAKQAHGPHPHDSARKKTAGREQYQTIRRFRLQTSVRLTTPHRHRTIRHSRTGAQLNGTRPVLAP